MTMIYYFYKVQNLNDIRYCIQVLDTLYFLYFSFFNENHNKIFFISFENSYGNTILFFCRTQTVMYIVYSMYNMKIFHI